VSRSRKQLTRCSIDALWVIALVSVLFAYRTAAALIADEPFDYPADAPPRWINKWHRL
jgi:hypothetical protein